jgi:hypothetical protein
MSSPPARREKIPDWLRWSAILWLLIWFPAYWHTWGAANFLHLCDLAVGLTCIGLWTNSPLLLSSQAISSLVIDAMWTLDVVWRFLFGRHIIGRTEYLFDARFSLWVRVLSLFHVVMPLLLLWVLLRIGYDRRGLALQSAIAFFVLMASRFAGEAANINFSFTDPFFHRAWGPAPVHLALTFAVLVVFAYFPTHLLLKKLFPAPSEF